MPLQGNANKRLPSFLFLLREKQGLCLQGFQGVLTGRSCVGLCLNVRPAGSQGPDNCLPPHCGTGLCCSSRRARTFRRQFLPGAGLISSLRVLWKHGRCLLGVSECDGPGVGVSMTMPPSLLVPQHLLSSFSFPCLPLDCPRLPQAAPGLSASPL